MEIVFVGDHQEPIHDCDDHRHSDWELVLYRDGVGETFIEGTAYPFSPGSVFLIPPAFLHRSVGENVFSDRFVHIRDFSWPVTDRPSLFLDDEHRLETLLWYLFVEFHGSSTNRAAALHALGEAESMSCLRKLKPFSFCCSNIFPIRRFLFLKLLRKRLTARTISGGCSNAMPV